MEYREKLEAYLRENRVPFELQHHARAFTAQEVAERGHVHGRQMTKVVIVVAGGSNVMLVLPAPSRVDLKLAAAALRVEDVRLAREDEFERAFPDCELGAMPPFGNLYGLRVVLDRALTVDETIYFQAGTHSDTMSLRYADFELLVRPTVAEFGRTA